METRDQHVRDAEIFAGALRVSMAGRTSYLASACGDDVAGTIEWAQRSTQSRSLDVRVMSLSLLAMAHSRIGNTTAVQAFADNVTTLVEKSYPAHDSGDLGADGKEGIAAEVASEWKGGVFARVLLKEVQTVIESKPKMTVNAGGPDHG